MIDGRGSLRYSGDVQRDRRTGKDNFWCKFADLFSPCEGIEININTPIRHIENDLFSPCEGIEILNTMIHIFITLGDALSPCEGIETISTSPEILSEVSMHLARVRVLKLR